MKVIAISGKAQHGKDTVATLLKKQLESTGNSVLVTHYADLVKYVCTNFFNWNGVKDEYGRSLLQRVGTDIVRKKCPDYWVNFVVQMLTFFNGEWDYVLIPDCRFPNEVDCMKEAGLDTVHVRVVRSNFETTLTPEQQAHPSETALDNCVPDKYIFNDGTVDDLQDTISSFVSDLHGYHQMTMPEWMSVKNEIEKANRTD